MPILAVSAIQDHFRSVTGLPISTYFSAYKFRWLVENVPEVKQGITEGKCLMGTVDSWLIWNLTGGTDGKHRTPRLNPSSQARFLQGSCQPKELMTYSFLAVNVSVISSGFDKAFTTMKQMIPLIAKLKE